MNNAEIKGLALKLATANCETDAIEILKTHKFWEDDTAWLAFGGRENNVGTIMNQSAKSEFSLCELLTNSCDALMQRKCLAKGIDPESDDAPSSIFDAGEALFNVPSGKLSR